MTDPYATAAEFYDLMTELYWERLGRALPVVLAGAIPSAGPVVDLGAGTGLSTVAVADALPDATVLAVEPSRAMRGVLLSRLVARRDLRDRVTVLPADLATAELPDRLGGVVALNMLGHLDRAGRGSLWRLLAARLARGAPAVVGLQPPARPEVIPNSRYARTRLGGLEYEGWGTARPAGSESVRWTMTYRVLRDGQLVDERTAEFLWWTIGEQDVAAEAAATGLTCERGKEGLLVLRRAQEDG